jgi:hypothetical protein
MNKLGNAIFLTNSVPFCLNHLENCKTCGIICRTQYALLNFIYYIFQKHSWLLRTFVVLQLRFAQARVSAVVVVVVVVVVIVVVVVVSF